MRLFLPLSSVLLGTALTFGQTYTVSGSIRDSSTNEALAAATIRVVGSATGTISNSQGRYSLTLPVGEYALAFSYIGYRTDTLSLTLDRDTERSVSLVSSPVRVAEVVITGEDPAMGIMRKVIENKMQWAEKLHSYRLEAFTRQVVERDTAIALISESYSTCYWQRGDTLREVIRQKLQTENINGAQNFAGVDGILNIYDDEIRLSGFRFVGPTSPEAFSYYDFRLERTLHREGADIYEIKMIPRTRVVPLFKGTISIAQESYAVAGISVTPNEAFAIPMISNLKLSYAQQFSLFDREFWMPVDIRISGFFEVSIMGITIPPIGVESISSIYDCKVNIPIPDSIFHKPRRIALKESEQYDSTFWAQHDVLPLTVEEKSAYHRLDSTQTLEKQFQPSGPLVTAGDLFSESPVSPQVRFNRVEGLFLGVSATRDSLSRRIKATVSAGYGFSDRSWKGRVGVEYFFDQRRDFGLRFEAYDDNDQFLTGGAHDNTENLFATLLYKIDYFDYFKTRGFAIALDTKPWKDWSVDFGYRNEDQSSVARTTNYSLFSRDRTFMENPPIREGTLRTLWLTARYGDEPFPVPIIPRDFVQLDVEHTSPGLGSAFNFTRVAVQGEYHIATYLRSLFLPPSLTFTAASGLALGVLSPQRFYAIDSPLLDYAPMGVLRGVRIHEFSGDTYVVTSLEHNFRSVPFLWMNIPYLYKNSIEVIAYVNVARSWVYAKSAPPSVHPTDGIYSEAGLGLSRIFGLIRVDVTRRFSPPARYVVTMGVAMIL